MAEANQPEGSGPAAADAGTGAPAENVPNLVLDEVTGDMVSKK